MYNKGKKVFCTFLAFAVLVLWSIAFYGNPLRNPPLCLDPTGERHELKIYETTEPTATASTSAAPYQTDPVWIVVEGRRLLLRSAYADLNESWRVRVLSYKYCTERGPVQCHFHGKFLRFPSVTSGTFDYINMAGDGDCTGTDYYEAHFLYCGLPPTSRLALFRPTEVSVSPINPTAPVESARVSIDYLPRSKLRMAVCVPAMVSWTDPYALILFLEYYTSQGVDHFLIYYRSSTPAILSVLDHYSKLGVIQVIPWPLAPLTMNQTEDPNPKMNYHGQLLAIADCLWRLRYRASYVALIDLDEFIVPAGSNAMTVLDLISKLDKPSIGGFMFLSSFVYVAFPWFSSTRPLESWNEVFNFTQFSIFKDMYIHSPETRSKMIVKPEAIQKQTVHSAWKFSPSYQNYVVETGQALLYHFRSADPSAQSSNKSGDALSDLLRQLFIFDSVIPLDGLQ